MMQSTGVDDRQPTENHKYLVRPYHLSAGWHFTECIAYTSSIRVLCAAMHTDHLVSNYATVCILNSY